MVDTLTIYDVTKLERRDVLKEELKTLDKDLKPKIQATFTAYGAGNVTIGSRIVKLSSVDRNSVSWKGLAESCLPVNVIEEEKPRHTTQSTTFGAKITGRASLSSQNQLGRKIA